MKNLQSKKETLQAEIAQLELVKRNLTIESKLRDTIISKQNMVITQSSDSLTKKQGEKLSKELQESSIFKTLVNPSKDGIDSAKIFERKGYQALFNKDIKTSIQCFKQSENSYNGYNQVYEIAFYLNGSQSKLLTGGEKAWKEIYKTILSEYSWKMPADVRTKLTNLTGAH
ncbi:MAG: hypothetical protein EOO43_05010 [Flavobacterium sp.]|nr:MAG: hypothetical protein EOO43_05010 [Flavobacterium sp.]